MGVGVDCRNKKELVRAVFAEFLGMTFFVFAGCGSAISSGVWNETDGGSNTTARLMPIAMNFGIGIVVLLYCIAGISGGHLNPAVTFFLFVIKKTTAFRAFLYISVQFLGAIMGAFILWASTSDAGYGQPALNLGANSLAESLSGGQGLLLEVMETMLLCLTVFFTEVRVGGPTDGKPNLALLCIGLSVFLAHVVLIPLTGCGINPARTFHPAMVELVAAAGRWSRRRFLRPGRRMDLLPGPSHTHIA
jgi:aquaporin PIP